MSLFDGLDDTICVDDIGKIRLNCHMDLTGATGAKVLVYKKSTWDRRETPDKEPAASLVAPTSDGIIEADNDGSIFASPGEFILRSEVTWVDGPTYGAPFALTVIRGK